MVYWILDQSDLARRNCSSMGIREAALTAGLASQFLVIWEQQCDLDRHILVPLRLPLSPDCTGGTRP